MRAPLLLLLPLLLAAPGGAEFWDSEFENSLFTFVRYNGLFVSVFRHASQPSYFFYTPLAVLQHGSGSVYFNFLKDLHEVNFRVVMTTDALEAELLRHLRGAANVTAPRVQLLPMETVRFAYASALRRGSMKLDLETTSVPNNHLPRSLTLRFYAFSQREAAAFRRAVGEHPETLDQLVLEYTITSRKAAQKQVEIKATYIAQADLFAKLVTMATPGSVRYLNARDVNRMAVQSSSVIKAKVVRSREYIEGPDELRLTQVVQQLLSQEATQWRRLAAEARESIFWDPMYARPDEVTRLLNRVYEKESGSSRTLKVKESERSSLEQQKSESTACYVFKCSSNSTDGLRRLDAREKLTDQQMRDFLRERSIEVEMSGRMFVVKNMRLFRVNTAHFSGDRTIATSSVQISKKKEIHSVKLKTDSQVQEKEAKLVLNSCGEEARAYKGCYSDRAAQRDLAGYRRQSATMRIGDCHEICRAREFKFFGLQRGDLCFCGSAYGAYGLRVDAECGAACSGDSRQRCGGQLRNSVFEILHGNRKHKPHVDQKQAPGNVYNSSEFEYRGCYATPADGRLPAAAPAPSGGVTVALCHSLCAQQAADWFALSGGSGCRCLRSAPALERLAETHCTAACAGDRRHICGSDRAVSLYAAAGVREPVTSPSASLAAHEEVGCYGVGVGAGGPLSRGVGTVSFSMTVGACRRFCAAARYEIFGVRDGHDCRCAAATPPRARAAAAADCATPCLGDKAAVCGGANHFSVFRVTAAGRRRDGEAATVTERPTAPDAGGQRRISGCPEQPGNFIAMSSLQGEGLSLQECANFCRGEGGPAKIVSHRVGACACLLSLLPDPTFRSGSDCPDEFYRLL